MATYPLHFKATVSSSAGISESWSTKALAFGGDLAMAVPPEFNGPGTGYSPEDLYALALGNCFVATFKVVAQNSKLDFENLAVNVDLEVDKDEKGSPWMARTHLQIQLKKPSDSEKAQRILERVSKTCLILNSVKTEKTFSFEIL